MQTIRDSLLLISIRACEAHILRALAMLVPEEPAGHSTFLEHYILDFKQDLMFNYMKHTQI
jgi:hypothetical protein